MGAAVHHHEQNGDEPILVVRDVTKTFPGSRALDSVNFSLHANEVHTLVGQNGAGKSTLVKMICGGLAPDEGSLTIGGSEVDHHAKNYLEAHSIGYVSQEGSLDLESTAYENIFLNREHTRFGLVSYRSMYRTAQALADRYGFDIDLKQKISNLSPSERKIVEILRALSLEPKVLVLDEPTAALPKPDIDHLLQIMRSLAKSTSIIFISHYMDEIFNIGHRVTVMRDGRDVWSGQISDTNPDEIVTHMLGERAGRKHDAFLAERSPGDQSVGRNVLDVTGLSTKDGKVADASVYVAAGEIVGLFGMVGAGKTELLEALYGIRRIQDAELKIGLAEISARLWNVRGAIARGLALVPEDRLKNALIATESASWNLAAPYWRGPKRFFAGLGKMEHNLAESATKLVTIRGSLVEPISSLSGGNKQKISVTRWLVGTSPPTVLLLDEPTQGLDVVAREEIYALARELAAAGTGVLLASSDLEEAVTVSDRLYVMRAGRTTEMNANERTREGVLLAAISGTSDDRTW